MIVYHFKTKLSQAQWLTLVILANQEAKIRRIAVQSQPGQIVCDTLSQKKKKKSQKRAGGVTQAECSVFKDHYHTHTKKVNTYSLSIKNIVNDEKEESSPALSLSITTQSY
jgi:hypothetical protein